MGGKVKAFLFGVGCLTGDFPDYERTEERLEGEEEGGEPFGVFGVGEEVRCLSVEIHWVVCGAAGLLGIEWRREHVGDSSRKHVSEIGQLSIILEFWEASFEMLTLMDFRNQRG